MGLEELVKVAAMRDIKMMPWFKIKKQINTSINGVDLGQKPKLEVTVEEEKILQPKLIFKKIIKNV